MGGYRVDPAQLADAERGVRAAAAAARAGLAGLQAAAGETLSTGWQSPAAAAFRSGWDEWVHGVTAMLDALDLLGSALSLAGLEYAATESAVAAATRQVAS